MDGMACVVVRIISGNNISIKINLDQIACRDFLKEQSIRIDKIPVILSRRPRTQMGIDQIRPAIMDKSTIATGQLLSCLPFLFAYIVRFIFDTAAFMILPRCLKTKTPDKFPAWLPDDRVHHKLLKLYYPDAITMQPGA